MLDVFHTLMFFESYFVDNLLCSTKAGYNMETHVKSACVGVPAFSHGENSRRGKLWRSSKFYLKNVWNNKKRRSEKLGEGKFFPSAGGKSLTCKSLSTSRSDADRSCNRYSKSSKDILSEMLVRQGSTSRSRSKSRRVVKSSLGESLKSESSSSSSSSDQTKIEENPWISILGEVGKAVREDPELRHHVDHVLKPMVREALSPGGKQRGSKPGAWGDKRYPGMSPVKRGKVKRFGELGVLDAELGGGAEMGSRVKVRWGKVGKWFKKKAKQVVKVVVKKVSKIGMGLMKGLIPIAKKLMATLTPKIIQKIMGFSPQQYKCVCEGYAAQVNNPKYGYVGVPGWTESSSAHWKTKDPGPVYFSFYQVPTAQVQALPRLSSHKNPVCVFDVKFNLQWCRKNKEYLGIGSRPGCKAVHDGVVCSKASEELYKKGIQCRPDKNHCEGTMIKRLTEVRLAKGSDSRMCQRTFAVADAAARAALTVLSAINNERSVRAPCDKVGAYGGTESRQLDEDEDEDESLGESNKADNEATSTDTITDVLERHIHSFKLTDVRDLHIQSMIEKLISDAKMIGSVQIKTKETEAAKPLLDAAARDLEKLASSREKVRQVMRAFEYLLKAAYKIRRLPLGTGRDAATREVEERAKELEASEARLLSAQKTDAKASSKSIQLASNAVIRALPPSPPPTPSPTMPKAVKLKVKEAEASWVKTKQAVFKVRGARGKTKSKRGGESTKWRRWSASKGKFGRWRRKTVNGGRWRKRSWRSSVFRKFSRSKGNGGSAEVLNMIKKVGIKFESVLTARDAEQADTMIKKVGTKFDSVLTARDAKESATVAAASAKFAAALAVRDATKRLQRIEKREAVDNKKAVSLKATAKTARKKARKAAAQANTVMKTAAKAASKVNRDKSVDSKDAFFGPKLAHDEKAAAKAKAESNGALLKAEKVKAAAKSALRKAQRASAKVKRDKAEVARARAAMKRAVKAARDSAAKKARDAKAKARKGYLHTAAPMQTLARLMSIIDTLQVTFDLLDYVTLNAVCPASIGNMHDESACTGISIAANSVSSLQNQKLFYRHRFKGVDIGPYYSRNTLQKKSERLGEAFFKGVRSNKGAMACEAVSYSRFDANAACGIEAETLPQEKISRIHSKEFFGEEVGKVAAEGLAEAWEHFKKDKEMAEAIHTGAEMFLIPQEDLGESHKVKFFNLKQKIMDKIKSMGAKILPLVVPPLLKKISGTTDAVYKCICVGYGGQIFQHGKQTMFVPSWHHSATNNWRNRDHGPINFSVVKIAKKHYGGMLKASELRYPLCKFDASFRYRACFKEKKFNSLCAHKGCRMSNGGDDCMCGLAGDAAYYKKAYQCNPDKNSCEGGNTIKRDLKFENTIKSQKWCQKSFSSHDAIVRAYTGLMSAFFYDKTWGEPCARQNGNGGT